jgi:hypothetical protein
MPSEADGNCPEKTLFPAISVPKFTLKADEQVTGPG